jgi:choline dehydrogenase
VLVRSGIGDRRELDRLGVDVVADVPGVGAGLQDHPAVAVVARLRDPSLAAPDLPLIQTILRCTAPGSEHRADLQLELLTRATRRPGDGRIAVAAVLEQCESRGEVRQRSADPASTPRVEPRFCVDDRDAARLAAALVDADAFLRRGPLADLVDEVVFPAPGRDFDLDARRHVVRTRAGSGYHPTGTARMGPAGDPGAVVDERGRCHAVDGLVVADASILPSVPRANTNLTSIAVGERVGELLRTDPGAYGLG